MNIERIVPGRKISFEFDLEKIEKKIMFFTDLMPSMIKKKKKVCFLKFKLINFEI